MQLEAVPTIVYKLRQRATLCMCISTIGSRQMEPSGSRSGNREPREAFERTEVLGSLEALEALIFSECSERQTRLQRASEQLRHLRRLERVALAGADVRRLAQLRQLQQELLEFADLRSLRSLRSRSGDHDGIPSEKAEKSVPSLLRDVRHWHAELRRLEQLEAFQLKSESSWSGPLTLTAEISVLRQVLAEQEEGRKACEECLRLRHPASSAALPLAGTPPSTLSACNASVAAGIRLATGAARAQLPKIRAMCSQSPCHGGFGKRCVSRLQLQDSASASMHIAHCTGTHLGTRRGTCTCLLHRPMLHLCPGARP